MSDGIEVTLSWESPLPVDDLPTVQAYVLLKSLGISNDSIMRKLGYDPEEEMKKSAEEDAQAMANNPLAQQLPPTEPGVAGLPGQPPGTQSTPLQGGNQQQNGGQQ
ncbi:MAG TPA: hypothetical protein VF974_06085 [Patescibacteria group bacterium]